MAAMVFLDEGFALRAGFPARRAISDAIIARERFPSLLPQCAKEKEAKREQDEGDDDEEVIPLHGFSLLDGDGRGLLPAGDDDSSANDQSDDGGGQ